jgi:hypothetical protein
MELIDVTKYNRYYYNQRGNPWVTPIIVGSCYIAQASSHVEPRVASRITVIWWSDEEAGGYP